MNRPLLSLISGVAASGLVLAACGDASDDAMASAAAALAEPVGAFSADVETRLLHDDEVVTTVMWRIEYTSDDDWTATVVEADGEDAPTKGYRREVDNGVFQEVEPDVVDLLEYFTPAELRDFSDRLGAEAQDVVSALVRDGVFVPGDDVIVRDELGADDRRMPHPLFELFDYDNRFELDDLQPRSLEAGGIRLTFEGDTFDYDAEGEPLLYRSFADGELVATGTVVRFESRPDAGS